MKNILKYSIAVAVIAGVLMFSGIPRALFANFGVSLNATSTTQGWIFPTKVNGTEQTIVAQNFISTSTSLFSFLTNLLFTNATGTSATTTNLFSTNASTTNLFIGAGTGCLQLSSGKVASTGSNCTAGTVTSVGLADANSTLTIGNTPITSTGNITATLNLANANIWTASTTFTGGLNAITATTTSATTTNFFSTNASTTNLQVTKLGISTTTPFAALSVGSGYSVVAGENTLATSTSMTVNWLQGNQQLVRTGTSATTIAFSNYIAGQKLTLIVCSPGASAGAVTFSGVLWPGSTAPTTTITANKCDIVTFLATNATSSLVIMGGYNQNY